LVDRWLQEKNDVGVYNLTPERSRIRRCENCRITDAEERDLLVRNEGSDKVYLCDACYNALEEEFVWGNDPTHG